jgi:hypothetical protein
MSSTPSNGFADYPRVSAAIHSLQLGKKFTTEENAKIVAFLNTLTGDQPAFLMPILPPSTDKTPPPKPFG